MRLLALLLVGAAYATTVPTALNYGVTTVSSASPCNALTTATPLVVITTAGDVVLNGLSGTGVSEGTMVTVIRTATATPATSWTVTHNSGSAAAGNAIYVPGSNSALLLLRNRAAVVFVYRSGVWYMAGNT